MAPSHIDRVIDLMGGRRRVRLACALALSVLLSAALVAARVHRTGTHAYAFLLWNTALALVPLGASTLARYADRRGARAPVVAALLAVWLVFLPNAPYMVTDFLHLRPRAGVPLWYDVALLFTFAWNGLVVGLLALHDAHEVVARRAGARVGWAFTAAAIGLSGFGVYLGRYPRWNSWDVVTQPGRLVADVAHRLAHPAEHPRTYGVTLLFSAFLAVAYLTFREFTGLAATTTATTGARRE